MNFTPNDFLLWFLNVVFKRKFLILTIFFIVIGLTVYLTFKAEPVYLSSSQVLVKIGRENVYVPTRGDAINPIVNSSSVEQINSEIELIRSKNVHENVLLAIGPKIIFKDLYEDKPKTLQKIKNYINRRETYTHMEEALLRFQKSLEVEGLKNSRIIQIGFKHNDPQIAARVAQTLVNHYLSERLQVHQGKRSYDFFKGQTELLKSKIRRTENRLKAHKEEHNIVSLTEERNLLLEQKAAQLTSLNETKSQKIETEKRIDQLSKQLKATPKNVPQGEIVERNALLINTLEARLVELELEEKDLLSKYTDESRMVQGIRNEIRTVREKLAEQESKHEVRSEFGLNPTYQRLQDQLFQNQVDLRALNAKTDIQTEQLAEFRLRIEDISKAENRLNELQNELNVNRENYRLYLTKFEESRIDSEMDSKHIANISIIKQAEPPIKPVSPNVPLNIVIGFGLAAAIGLALPFLLETLRDNIERPEDIESYLDAPVLASISEFKF